MPRRRELFERQRRFLKNYSLSRPSPTAPPKEEPFGRPPRAPSTTVEGGDRGGQGETGFAPPGAVEANHVSCSGQKSNRALLGADFLGTANRKFEGWDSPGVEAVASERSGQSLPPGSPDTNSL